MIGLSKFCELRPKWCISVGGASGLHAVCVCEYHQNVKLLVSQIPGVSDYRILLEKVVCDTTNRICMLHGCDNCPGSSALKEYLKELFEEHSIDHVNFRQWQKSNFKCSLYPTSLHVDEFIDEVCSQIDTLCQHHFIAKSQSAYLQHVKTSLKPGHALILLDFAENYSFLVQDAIQGFHWNNSQATLHPFVVYQKTDNKIVSQSFCVISDSLQHDSNIVHYFLHIILEDLKTNICQLKRCIYFSDGAASQYKNYKNFSNICNHEKDHGVPAEWHFFATSHGKSPCDGVGGTVKRLVSRASLQLTTDAIDTADKMFHWCKENINGIKFFYASKAAVEVHCSLFQLEARYARSQTIPGTRNHHSFIPISSTSLIMKRISFDDDEDYLNTSISSLHMTPDPPAAVPGAYVACIYDKNWFIGNVIEASEENEDIRVNFMKRSASATTFTWPQREDICWVPVTHILCTVTSLKVQSAAGRCYDISNMEHQHILSQFQKFTTSDN